MSELENTRQLNLDDYLAILRRRKWWIIVPALLGPMIAYAVSLKLPSRYTSQTLVLVEQQKVPDSFVKPVVTGVLDERLATMQEQILSRTRLEPIIDQFGLYRDKQNLSVEDKLGLMRKAIEVTPLRSDGAPRGTMSGFYVSYTSSDAHLAQQVCGQLTSMFMSENVKVREERSQGTTKFIESQLRDAKANLDEQDEKLADFKRRYIGQLPGEDQANFNMLASLNAQLDATTQALSQLQQNRTYAETMLTGQLQTQQNLQGTGLVSASPDTLEQQLAKDQAMLSEMLSKYTETHPDVVRLKKDIEQLKSKMEAHASAPPTAPLKEPKNGTESAQIQQLRAQLAGIEQAIHDKQKEQARVQQQIEKYQARIQLSPAVEAQYKSLTRDHESAQNFYNELLGKRNQSEMATDLERRQEGEQFRVLDPPNLPEKPTFPDRRIFAAGGFGGGLALGLGIVFALEFLKKSIRTDKDVLFYLQLPTLTTVPDLEPDSSKGKNRFFRWKKNEKSLDPEAA
jgi:polysaccharide chain length determinant protein (PEP-CTERM system associated)